ncbi:MAG TPA: M56 family metallopeptidase [Candidatus Angelobacter sp.]|jgi:beta-lactamase regulating signal transducer with metallopeptidase domain
MFTMLAIALCLAVMFLVLTGASVLSTAASRLLLRRMGSITPGTKANLLFVLRLMPLALGCVVTFGLALPSFLEFEPSSTKEGMGFRLMALAILGALLLLGMLARGVSILHATSQAQRGWRERSERMNVATLRAPVYRVENGASLLAVTGILRPKIFVGSEIAEALSPDELHAALAHEMAHVSSFDNLKQFLLKSTRAPRWLKVLHQADAEWTNTSEIAADRAALAEGASVLDLSSALIKVGRLKRPLAGRDPVASHLVPSACSGALESRVTRLTDMLEGRDAAPARGVKRMNLFLPMLISLAVYLACIHALLPAVHEVLELLVR